jgi:GNAT superfamily N-acetyltransferase
MNTKFKIIEFQFEEDLINKFAEFESKLYPNSNYQLTLLQLRKSYPVHRYAKVNNYMVLRNNEVVFRASAIINPYLQENNSLGLIGFFETISDYKLFETLMDKILQYFKQRNIKKIIAPLNFNTFHKYRFVTYGFDKYFILDIQNKEYYPDFFQKFGFKILKNYYSKVSTDIILNLELSKSKYDLVIKDGFKFRKMDKNSFIKECEKIYELSVNNFEDSFLYTEISFEEFIEIYKPFQNYLDIIQVYFAVKDDKEIGFIFSIFYQDYVVFKSMAIDKDYRNQGIGTALFHLLYQQALKKSINKLIYAFMREDNSSILKLTRNSDTLKKYSLFYYDL